MMTVLEAMAAALIKWLAGWLDGRRTKRAESAQELARSSALHAADTIRDTATQQEDASHAQTQADLDRLNADAGKSQRVQSEDVNAAISAANGDVR